MGNRAVVGVGAGALLGVVALVCAVVPTACVGHQCDYSEDTYGLAPGQGSLVPNDPNTWESNPIDAPWTPYPHAHRTKFFVPFVITPTGRQIVDVRIYISPDPNPGETPNTNWTTAAGNLAQVRDFGSQIWVDNGTCADFFMRAVITASPAAPVIGASPPDLDAGDAGVEDDAGPDAPTDADEGGN